MSSYGLVARTFAKLCPELGVDKTSFVVHHKEHITKVMGHATVGYLFTDDPELGGEGYCIGLHRCESFRVALKTTYETERDPVTNAIHHNSKIVKNRKGDLYRVAANVTGSNKNQSHRVIGYDLSVVGRLSWPTESWRR